MAMQVILKEDVHNLGTGGEIVTVKPGYGRNYLIPKGLAVAATAGNVKHIEHQKKIIAARNAKLQKDAQSVSDKLAGLEGFITRQAGEGDKLFGSVTGRDVGEALKLRGVIVDHKKIVLPEPIKALGSTTVDVRLGQGVIGKLKVTVAASK